MQTQNRLFDDLARVAGGALGALSGLREEVELIVRGRLERMLADMDLVGREEFDAVKASAAAARLEAEALAARVAELEARLDKLTRPTPAAAKAASTTARRHAARPAAAKAAPRPAKAAPPQTEPAPEPASGNEPENGPDGETS